MDGRGSDAEIEWQLDAPDLTLVRRWIESVGSNGADGLTIGRGRTVAHADTYLDTKDRRLDRAGYSVRLRHTRGLPPEATLKSLDGVGPDGLRVRLELTERLEHAEPMAVARALGPVGERVRALAGRHTLGPLFELQTRRRSFPLEAEGAPSGELLLDETAIREPGGRVLSRLRRVEVEVPETALDAVGPLVESLQGACGLRPAVLSKYEAGLAAAGNRRTELESLGRTTVEPDDTIGQVGLAVLRRQLGALVAHEPGTRLGDDPEELHDMRVASRRLRAAISLFGEALPAEAARLGPEVAWVGRTIGAVRDLDVQLAQLERWATALPPRDVESLERIRAVLADGRREARTEMLEALDSRRYERLVRRFASLLRTRSGTRTPPARALAPDLVVRRHKALRKAMAQLDRDADPAAYHRLRIAGKRFRYALEFVAEVYPGETRRLVRRTATLQDVLGAYQDAHVASTRLRALAAEPGPALGPETVFTMGEVTERYRARMEELRGEVTAARAGLTGKAWKRLRKRMDAARPPLEP
jgi:triphosphatase